MTDAVMPRRTLRQLLTARRGRGRLHWTDAFAYAYLAFGVFLMFGPVIWLVLSSFKTPAGLLEFPPTFLPLGQISVEVEGYDKPLPLYRATLEDGTVRYLAQIRRIGIVSQMVDPADPSAVRTTVVVTVGFSDAARPADPNTSTRWS